MVRLVTRNVPESMNDQMLHQLFGQYGAVVRVLLVGDDSTDGTRGFAFIDMARQKDALRAMAAINRQMLAESELEVRVFPLEPSDR